MDLRRRPRRTRNMKKSKVSTSSSVTKRLQTELISLMSSSHDGISAFPEPENFLTWRATIHGPGLTVYEGLIFRLRLHFPEDYPFSAPLVLFETPCFHPNVDLEEGNLCLDILKENWSAIYNVSSILISIQSLLGSPNNDSPLNPLAATLWEDQEAYKKVLMGHYTKPSED